MPTVSIAKGQGYARHNDRTLQSKSIEKRTWDSELSYRNIVYKNEPVQNEYAKVFHEALAKYNQNQIDKKHPERQIKNYYEKISRSKQEKASYELIIQIGDMTDKQNPDRYRNIQSALNEYNQSFQKRNPNFHVFQQITHRDEKGMDHTHIMFFPVSTGNKRGLEVKNSISGALKEMGYGRNGFSLWREHEINTLTEIMREHNLEFELGDNRQEHLNVRQYKEFKKYESKTIEQQNALSKLEKSVSSVENDLSELKLVECEIDDRIAFKHAQIKKLENQKEILQKNPTREIVDNPHIKEIIRDIHVTYQKQKNENTLSEQLTDNDITIKTSLFGEKTVTMPYLKWTQIRDRHNKLLEKFNEMRKVFNHGLDKIINLFERARQEPEYLSAVEYTRTINQQKSKINELENRIKTIQRENNVYQTQINDYEEQIQEYANDSEILGILGSEMKNTTLIDQYSGEEINMLDSIMDKAKLTDSAIDSVNNRVEEFENCDLYQEKTKNDWDLEL